jgi:hypothetical protein
LYQNRYPQDIYGWYLGGRAKEGMDTTYELGLAKPDYDKVISIGDTTKDINSIKDKLIPAYRYMVAYFYNIKHQADSALIYNNKILNVDSTDATALKTKDALQNVVRKQAEAGAANKPGDSSKAKKP